MASQTRTPLPSSAQACEQHAALSTHGSPIGEQSAVPGSSSTRS
jgi:hypothetical protein